MNWNNKAVNIISINNACVSTSTANFYLPVNGETSEDTSVTATISLMVRWEGLICFLLPHQLLWDQLSLLYMIEV